MEQPRPAARPEPAATIERPVQQQATPAAATIERPAPRQEPQAEQRPAETNPQAGGQGGWVRDLLRGASREDDTAPAPAAPQARVTDRSALQVVESLNSLSVDIARAIDHEASIELWNRYRRGERNVFTRRLYTLNGQQTFDEIRRKYQSDSEFRSAVNQYCEDFEKLLKDVSRNDRDNMMTQTYLSSDTGKVYTMLAHASGRLR